MRMLKASRMFTLVKFESPLPLVLTWNQKPAVVGWRPVLILRF